MKQLFLILAVFGFSISFAQKLEYNNGKIFQDGEQISSFETKKVLASDLKALHLFKKAKSKESLGGFILGLGIGGTVADLVMGLTSDVKYPTAITYVGVGLMAVSIPILSGRKKMVQESVDIYNDGLQEQKKTLGDNFELNIVNNSNGVGLQINF
ncbi:MULTISPECIES: hypothetical protein [unclassified Flavobacterium]|uniref:hypothetical protein n=1 Tax=unclassified Flavobacterium TaxID=196869 RepID=UPI0012925F7E|nr:MULTISPECIES: hypothetical protein [unclassified Flavobacterium]MQP52450.1 hypothetical protein [Flavobacterium sp. LMO9]MQP62520.1 hypothetical protein [Flavobacterium sp. LMO6]